MNKTKLSAIAALVGGTIGVGIFGLPLVFVKAGWLMALIYLVVLTAITLALNLAYGEIVLRTKRAHHLIGYATVYLGQWARWLMLFTITLGFYSALLAYIIVGGDFLSNISGLWATAWSPELASFIFFVVGALIVAGGIKVLARVDLIMATFYLIAIGVLAFWSAPHMQLVNFTTNVWHWHYWFLPYGTILFAITGLSGVVVQHEILEGKDHFFKKAIIWGSLIPPVLYLIFSLVLLGVVGDRITPEAIDSLLPWLGNKAIILGSIFGLLAVFTSFINLSTVMQEVFMFDFKVPRFVAWLLALMPPYLFFLWQVRDYIKVIGFSGGVAFSIELIILILVYHKVKKQGHRMPEYSLHLPVLLWYLIGLVALSGLIYTLFNYGVV